jgi:LPXTG-site transpeptidase (sortase) family protein
MNVNFSRYFEKVLSIVMLGSMLFSALFPTGTVQAFSSAPGTFNEPLGSALPQWLDPYNGQNATVVSAEDFRASPLNVDSGAVQPYVVPSYPIYSAPNGLTIEPITAYNLVVDSNVLSPSTYAPTAATVGAKFCNSTGATMTNVWAYVGDYNPGSNSGTPGVYPQRSDATDPTFNTQHPHLDGVLTDVEGGDPGRIFALEHESGSVSDAQDASRYIGTLASGECRTQYWLISYPRVVKVDGKRTSVTGGIKPDDDLWLPYFFWAKADSVATSYHWNPLTMRNEISAMANKIWPNGDNKVPDAYKAAIDDLLGWDTITPSGTNNAFPGETVTSQGIWYDFGNVGAGFDNNGDGVPDRNAWVQPIGDQTIYDPGCFRLVRTYGIVIVKLNNGTELLIPFLDQMYFENIPSNNTGAVGLVYYEYVALDGACTASLTPYQEVASGFDNEKFNGDYGAGIPPLQSRETTMTLDKTGETEIGLNGTIKYSITFSLPVYEPTPGNAQTIYVGNPDLGMPLVFQETVPEGLQYVTGSASADVAMTNYATATVPATRLYSTDSGATWSATEPGTVGDPGTYVTSSAPGALVMIQWWVAEAIESPATGPAVTGTVSFDAIVPGAYTQPIVENTACIKLGTGPCFDEDTHNTQVTGDYSISGTVFEDDGTGVSFGNGQFDSGEGTIENTPVSLYVDYNGTWILWDTTVTDGDGDYIFNELPNGSYQIVVGDPPQGTHPGWTVTTEPTIEVTLNNTSSTDNDFGFAPALTLEKTLVGPDPALEDQLLTYTIDLNNELPGDGTLLGPSCVYTFWASSATQSGTGQNIWINPSNLVGLNNLYASREFSRAKGVNISADQFAISAQPGTISNVIALVHGYLSDTIANGDIAHLSILYNGVAQGTILDLSTAELNSHVGIANVSSWERDVTANRTWTWSDFTGNLLQFQLEQDKSGGGSSQFLYLDSMGFRVTTNERCGGDSPSSTINPLPLTDTYNADQLEFVSADPPETSVTIVDMTPDPAIGTIYWNNLGPLYAGGTETVTVTFRVKDGTFDETILNTATVDSATFSNGKPTNDDTDDADVLVNKTARIGDTIWNNNGAGGGIAGNALKDGTEAGLPGVTVRLTASTLVTIDGVPYAAGAVIQTVVTDVNGEYEFIGLPDATYTVTVDTSSLPGMVQNYDPDGGIANQSTVTISGGNDNLLQDFGYTIPNTIIGTIWHDFDADALKELADGELPLAGWTVELTGPGCAPCTTTTDANGQYVFGNLGDGPYTVTVTPLAGYEQTAESKDGSSLADVVACGSGAPAHVCDAETASITVSGGNIYPGFDFGYREVGDYDISGTVYADWDGNADQNGLDAGIAGVTVRLYSDSGALIAETTTDADGNYIFEDLPIGDYRVVVDQSTLPAGYSQTEDYDETGVCSTCDSRATTVEINGVDDVTDVDFGYQPVGNGTIGDLVWSDLNGDGTKDSSEPGIAGATVYLQVDWGDGYVTVSSQLTGADGSYLFENLPLGDYRVYVDLTDPNLPEDSYGHPYYSTTGTQDNTIVYFNAQITSLAPNFLTADFGFASLGAFGDTVYWDPNGNGTQDYNEAGIPLVTVYLYLFDDENENRKYDVGEDIPNFDVDFTTPYATAITDADGKYLFTALPPGTYVAIVDRGSGPIAGLTLTGDPDTDGVSCTTSPPEPWPGFDASCDARAGAQIFPGSGGGYMGADFGFQPAGVIGDRIWLDSNANGISDLSEPGIADVTVGLYVWNDNNNDGVYNTGDTLGAVVQTAVTDADGYYTFQDVNDGKYVVVVDDTTLPLGLEQAYDPDGTLDDQTSVILQDGSVTKVGPTCTALATGCDGENDPLYLDADFGYRYAGTSSLSGTLCLVPDSATGVCNGTVSSGVGAGEVAYGDVTVYLYMYDGSSYILIATTETAANGDYAFNNIPDNVTYRIIVGAPQSGLTLNTVSDDVPGDLTATNNPNGSNVSAYQEVTLVDAQDIDNNDFAYYSPVAYDYGDLPDIYKTLLNNSGARHIVPAVPNLYLGGSVDAEPNGQPTDDATGDGADEDGVDFVTPHLWTNDGTATANVTVVGSGYLYAWMDFNANGNFSNTGEFFIQGVSVSNVADQPFNFTVPAGTFGNNKPVTLYSRFRLFPDVQSFLPTLASSGTATNGEVEDYALIWDMTVEKTVSPATVAPDGTLTYTITVENTGNQPLTNLQVTDVLPDFNGAADGTAWSITSIAASITTDTAPVADSTVTVNNAINNPGSPYNGDSIDELLTGTNTLGPGDIATVTIVLQFSSAVPSESYNNVANVFTTQIGTLQDDADVTVADLPNLTVTKTNSDTDSIITAGSSFNWIINVTNSDETATFANGTTILSDTLPTGATYANLTGPTPGFSNLSCTLDTVANPNTITCTASGGPVTFQPDDTFTITVETTPSAAGTLTNTAIVDPGTVISESSETDNEASDTVHIFDLRPAKTIVATSEAFTGVVAGTERVTIGEMVRYRISFQLPEGNFTNVQFVDAIPSGMLFLDDGTATIAFVCTSTVDSCITSSVASLTGAGLLVTGNSAAVSPTFTVPANVIADSDDANTTFDDGEDVTFNLGNLSNTDGDSDLEYVVIEFNALVLNVNSTSTINQGVNNITGEAVTNTRNNYAYLNVDTEKIGENSPNAIISVAEPAITDLAKTVPAGLYAPGGSLTYTLTFSNTALGNNATTAFDIVLTDTFDSNLTLEAIDASNVTSTQGATCAGGTTFTASASASPALAPATGQVVTVNVSCLDPGKTVTVTVAATIDASVAGGTTIPNTASLTYTSLPGEKGSCATSPFTCTEVGDPGTLTGERTGAGGIGADGTVLNNYADSDSEDVTIVSSQADLSISKTDGVTSVAPNGTVTYTIVVSNAGPSAADGAVFTDASATGINVTGVTCGSVTGGAACPAAGDTTVALMQGAGIVIPTLPSGGSVTFSVAATITATSGSVTNTADVATPDGTNDPTPGNNTASDTDTVAPQADLSISKTDGVTSVAPNGTVTYTIVVSNAGPSAADGAVFTDASATGINVTGVSCGSATGGAACPAAGDTTVALMQGAGIVIPTLPSGGSVTFSVAATITATSGSVTNTADVATPDGTNDPTPGNNTASDTDTVDPQADLSISKTDGVTSVAPNGTVTYTIVVSNAGPSAADGAVFTDASATGINVTGVTCGSVTGGAACPTVGNTTVALMQGAGIVIPTLPSGGSVTFSVAATITATSGSVTNTADVATPDGTNDPTPGNNTASDTDTVDPQADLSISKTDGVTSVAPNGTVTYTIVVSNAGPSAADGAVFTDASATGVNVTGVTCGSVTGGAACPTVGNTTVALMQGAGIVIPTLPSGGSVTFSVAATITATSGSVTNTAEVATPDGTNDPTPGNNTASDTDTVDPQADLSISKTDGVTSVAPNGTVTYTIVVSNAGPSAADGAVFTDASATGINVTGVSCGSATGGAACPAAGDTTVALMQGAGIVIPTLPSGGSVTFSVAATITATSGSVTNTADVATPDGTNDPTPGNNTASDTDTVDPQADLSISKTDGVTSVAPNGTVTYTIVVSNAGPSAADGAVFTDASATGINVTGVTCGSVTGGAACPAAGDTTVALMQGAGIVIPTLPSGGSVTFSVAATITATSGSVTNTADVATPDGTNDPTPGNNTASDTDTVDPQADLSISKTDGVTSVAPNGTVTYTIVVSNAGPSAADGAVFTDASATGINVTGVTCGSVTGGAACPAAGDTTVALMQGAGIVIPTLPSGGSVTFSVAATITATSGSVTNTADVATPDGTNDPTPGNNTASDTDTVDPQADLSISKTDGVTSVTPNGTVTYTIVVSNAGPSAADGAVFTDASATGINVTGVSCGSATGGAACPAAGDTTVALMQGAGIVIPTLPSGGSVTFSVAATITATSGSVTNTADVATPDGTNDPTPGNNTASDTDTVDPQADLSISKTDGVTSVAPNGTVTYTIVVSNAGPSAADGAVFTDASATGINVTGVTCGSVTGGAACPTVGNTTVALMQGAGIVIPTLPSGGSVTFSVAATITATSGSVTNTAEVAAPDGTNDPIPGNNTDSDTDTVAPQADLSISKTANLQTVRRAGDIITYTLVVTNTGNVDLTSVTVSDPMLSGFYCGDPILPLSQPFTLLVGQSVACYGTYEVTQADIDGYGGDDGILQNIAIAEDANEGLEVSDVEDVDIVLEPLIGVAKQVASQQEVSPGTYEITYQILVRNYGSVVLNNVQVIDDLNATFPLPTTFSVQSITSADFAVNPSYNGASDTNLLLGTDSLDVADSGNITLVVRVIPFEAGPFLNTAIATGQPPIGDPVTDESQDGTDPDPEPKDGDPTNNNEPTPLDFGANIFDPPIGVKVFDDAGLPLLEWTMVWINNSNIVAVNARVSDPIPVGTTYSVTGVPSGFPVPGGAPADSTNIGVSCYADPTSTTTTTTLCYYEGPTPGYPLGRIIWEGSLGPDLGATNENNANNELYITFRINVPTETSAVYNVATIDTDLDGDNSYDITREVEVASGQGIWIRPTEETRIQPQLLPATGFAPGVLSALPAQSADLAYRQYAANELVLEIPALKLRQSIVGVPFSNGNWDVTWLDQSVGYLNGTAFPGWTGNTALTGHVYGANGLPGPFVNLSQLKWGDKLILYANGQKYTYEVRVRQFVAPADLTPLAAKDRSWLTLITCKEYDPRSNSYRQRVVVQAVLMSVEPLRTTLSQGQR